MQFYYKKYNASARLVIRLASNHCPLPRFFLQAKKDSILKCNQQAILDTIPITPVHHPMASTQLGHFWVGNPWQGLFIFPLMGIKIHQLVRKSILGPLGNKCSTDQTSMHLFFLHQQVTQTVENIFMLWWFGSLLHKRKSHTVYGKFCSAKPQIQEIKMVVTSHSNCQQWLKATFLGDHSGRLCVCLSSSKSDVHLMIRKCLQTGWF